MSGHFGGLAAFFGQFRISGQGRGFRRALSRAGLVLGGYVFVLFAGFGLAHGLAFQAGVGHGGHKQFDGADGVVIAGDDVIHEVGIAVGVGHGHNGNAQFAAFVHGDVFAVGVDDEGEMGQAVHAFDAAQGQFQFVHFLLQAQDFFFLVAVDGFVGKHAFQLLEAVNAFLDGLEVGQGAAHPAVGHRELAATFGLCGHGFLGLALGADEQHFAAVGHGVHHFVVGGAEQLDGLLQVDDVNAVAGAEDVGAHFGIPAAGLVAEVHAGFQHLLHADVSHVRNSLGLTAARADDSYSLVRQGTPNRHLRA